jgi:hypothetical protein
MQSISTMVISTCYLNSGSVEVENGADMAFLVHDKATVCPVANSNLRVTFSSVVESGEESKLDESLDGFLACVQKGKTATVVLGNGDSPEEALLYAVSGAKKLLQQTHSDKASRTASIMLSWYTISVDAKEILIDVLRRSANMDSSVTVKTPELIIRELSSGRGMLVTNLLEVECANDQEVDVVLRGAQHRLPYMTAGQDYQPFHSVIQMYLKEKADKPKGASAKKDFVARGALMDKSQVGRLVLVQLGALVSELDHDPVALFGPDHAAGALAGLAANPWVQHLRTVILWLQQRQVSPPFHRSRLVLLLKDLLLRRQSGALLLHLNTAAEGARLARSTEWLRLFGQLISLTASPTPALSPSPRSPSRSRATPSPPHKQEGYVQQVQTNPQSPTSYPEHSPATNRAKHFTFASSPVDGTTLTRRASYAAGLRADAKLDVVQGRSRSSSAVGRIRAGSSVSSRGGSPVVGETAALARFAEDGTVGPVRRRSVAEGLGRSRSASALVRGRTESWGSPADGRMSPPLQRRASFASAGSGPHTLNRVRSASVAGRQRASSVAVLEGGDGGEAAAGEGKSPGPRLFRSYVRGSLRGGEQELAAMAAAAAAAGTAVSTAGPTSDIAEKLPAAKK